MRRLVRAIMAISLIAGDAAQAASLTEPPSGAHDASRPVTREQARFQDLIDRDTATWKRLSASICHGCGAPPPPLEITRADPLPLRTQREAVAAVPARATAGRSATRPVSLRRADLQAREADRRGGLRAGSAPVRLTAQVRRYARLAHLRMLRHQRRLARLRAQRKTYALLAPEGRSPAHRLRLAELGTGFLRREEGSPGSRRPIPLPPQRPDALCTDDRGLTAARIHRVSACIEPR